MSDPILATPSFVYSSSVDRKIPMPVSEQNKESGDYFLYDSGICTFSLKQFLTQFIVHIFFPFTVFLNPVGHLFYPFSSPLFSFGGFISRVSNCSRIKNYMQDS